MRHTVSAAVWLAKHSTCSMGRPRHTAVLNAPTKLSPAAVGSFTGRFFSAGLMVRRSSLSRYRAALLLALLCGLRLGEVGELRLDDVDWKNGTIDISRALVYTPQTGSFAGDPKTEAGERLIALPPGMMAVLYETREYQKEVQTWAGDLWQGEGWIVHGWNGARLHHDTVSKWFRRFADANGFEGVRFHDLRHTHATILLANSIDVVAVATRLGHADPSTTLKVYAHALRRRDEDAARATQALLDRAVDDDETEE